MYFICLQQLTYPLYAHGGFYLCISTYIFLSSLIVATSLKNCKGLFFYALIGYPLRETVETNLSNGVGPQ